MMEIKLYCQYLENKTKFLELKEWNLKYTVIQEMKT